MLCLMVIILVTRGDGTVGEGDVFIMMVTATPSLLGTGLQREPICPISATEIGHNRNEVEGHLYQAVHALHWLYLAYNGEA
jgi:hypothetical protein